MTDAKRLSAPRLTRAGLGRLITVIVFLAVTATIFFLAAGSLQMTRAWLYYGGQLAYLVLSMAVIALLFPEAIETINARGKVKKDVKTWDKLFGLAYAALLLLQPAVAGWDAGRVHSFEAPWLVSILAFALTLLANAFVHWAMIVNKHAETGVRIQEDRHHVVVSSGPYRIVRHPFYSSLIMTAVLYPLAISSLFACIPGLAVAALLIWRTVREDETLRRELEGYEAFTRQTRYRLLPGVW
jgi:protein-S-isoprenylcysteine O-methyltransferase Ste14